MLKHAYQGNREAAFALMTSEVVINAAKTCPEHSYFLAQDFAILGEKEETLNWLENAVGLGLINYPLLAEKDPFLERLRGEERFKELMVRVKHEWETFEV